MMVCDVFPGPKVSTQGRKERKKRKEKNRKESNKERKKERREREREKNLFLYLALRLIWGHHGPPVLGLAVDRVSESLLVEHYF